ncbi:MAG: carboxypeptidase-like regulatory domain-containing protein, partial [Tannerella sp.]|nr:carboxypeptidase-like regulatory domain-containing protein [Tannerella sp.]
MKKVIYLFAILLIAESFSGVISAQTLRGKIVDSRTNEALAGASVFIKDDRATTGAVTGREGEFTLNLPALPAIIQAGFIGYKKQEIVVYEIPDLLNIELEEDFNLLNEVVVTARRQRETLQEVPIPVSVVTGVKADNAGAF